MLTVTKLGLPPELRRSLACTNTIENVMGRRVSRNVKYWRSPSMALRWAGAAMQEAAKGLGASRLQAATTSPDGARRSQGKSLFIERASCPNHKGCVGSQSATPASHFSTSSPSALGLQGFQPCSWSQDRGAATRRHARGRDREPALPQLVGDADLPESRLLEGNRHNGVCDSDSRPDR